MINVTILLYPGLGLALSAKNALLSLKN